jgi:hypothetical protein
LQYMPTPVVKKESVEQPQNEADSARLVKSVLTAH